DVGPGHEGLGAAAGEDEHAHAFIGLGLDKRLVQFGDGVAVQRIELVGPVNGDGADTIGIVEEEVGVGHGSGNQKIRRSENDRRTSRQMYPAQPRMREGCCFVSKKSVMWMVSLITR